MEVEATMSDLRLRYCGEIIRKAIDLDRLGRPSGSYVARAHEAMQHGRSLAVICSIHDDITRALAWARLCDTWSDRLSSWWREYAADTAYMTVAVVGLTIPFTWPLIKPFLS